MWRNTQRIGKPTVLRKRHNLTVIYPNKQRGEQSQYVKHRSLKGFCTENLQHAVF